MVLTNEAQPPKCLILTNQEAIVLKGNDVWECILSTDADGRSTLDITDIIYTPLQGRSLRTNRFSVTRRFVSQFGFIS